ncbi:GNAT family N-acetyltransferase [Actinophytocola oryzae]|uniref:RimJ/RimL family protein N-acetyltransferase n=1 Tax=Actinophytocola oryzae TaxID=502181 RepID=A0A4R7VDB0_9PSEU|nr:GNAT family N-acetyltransferase [Actinophytocola oryzae]TDV47126.1 RimJ/RimL family protein N-acetyltransferase [Actinophytocola oryzae]
MRAQLGSGEVTLRRWRESDAGALYEVVVESIDHLRPWMAWVADGYTPQAAADFVTSTAEDWARGAAYNYAIFVSGRLAGATSLMARIGPGGLEIGYWLHPAYVGVGVATRAASLLTAEAFRQGVRRVEIVTDVANLRSAAVPKRLGFVEVERRPPQEPLTPGEDGLDVVWRLTPDRG